MTRRIVSRINDCRPYIVFWQIVHMKEYLLLLLPLSVMALVIPAFAQGSDNRTQYDIQANSTSGEPVLEQISEKGIYKVLFKWPTQISNQEGGIDVEIVFLNASAPTSTETNRTGINTPATTGSNETTVEPTLSVKSYDMTIFSGNGKEIWKKVDQPGLGGRGAQTLQFEGNYTGPISIEISNIKPGWDTGGSTNENEMIDSVKFMATVVPEFPLVVLLLAGGMAAVVALVRTRFNGFTQS
jgi:hypothetical protein